MAIIAQHQEMSPQNAAKKVKAALKQLTKQTLDDRSQKIYDTQVKNDDKLPHNFVSSIIS